MTDKASSISMGPEYLSLEVIQAIQHNDVPRLKLLQKCGTNFNTCDQAGNTVFHLAIQNHAKEATLDTFEYLLTLDDITKDEFNSFARTPLMEAFGTNDGEIYAIRLIESGCNVDHIYPDGNNVLQLAVYNNWIEVAELLIERGINIEYQNEDGLTALHIAVKKGYIDIVWMLLFFGADPNTTHMDYYETENGCVCVYFTFFDLVEQLRTLHRTLEVFPDQFYCYKKNFSLYTFIEVMQRESPMFYRLLEITCDINFTYGELKELALSFSELNPKMLMIFTQEFGYILEEMLCRCCLEDLFWCLGPYYLHNYAQNLFMLLESSVSDTFVDKINASNLALLTILIQCFAESRELVDLLCQILCCMASYGVDITADALNALYVTFGYCDLFKIMLHMDIKQMERCTGKNVVFPRLLYDVNLSIESVISGTYDEPTAYKISQYFILPKYRLVQEFPVPTLLELARNRAREYIIKKFKVKNSRDFYTVLRVLPLAEYHKKIISFEVKLYSL
ncbi:ankyrin repeat-containing protein kinase A-like [Zophobas morio]|uniref:ankyrin repeat-containing protein kinase A-like n=1 Tax=Zophobas morio TaxID=2755281 RepID=UPI003082AF35